jgi:hypothetical protein
MNVLVKIAKCENVTGIRVGSGIYTKVEGWKFLQRTLKSALHWHTQIVLIGLLTGMEF